MASLPHATSSQSADVAEVSTVAAEAQRALGLVEAPKLVADGRELRLGSRRRRMASKPVACLGCHCCFFFGGGVGGWGKGGGWGWVLTCFWMGRCCESNLGDLSFNEWSTLKHAWWTYHHM